MHLIAAALLVLASTVLAFLPGPYDSTALALLGMSQVLAFGGVLLVPIGLAWLAFRGGYRFALVAIAVATFVVLVMGVAATTAVGATLGVGVVAMWLYAAARLVRRLRSRRGSEAGTFNPAPWYLIVLPLVAAASHWWLVGPMAERSRQRAIANAAPMIEGIERFKQVHGHYPLSLHARLGDYDPGVLGVSRYYYEPHGEAYNLFFNHWSGNLATDEVVMYNPRDEQQSFAHDADRLEWTGRDLDLRAGHHAVGDAGRPHWKRFWFD